jgi:hypothetical protein
MGNGLFGDPGFLGMVWIGCVAIQILAWSGVALPGWLVLSSFFGAVGPIIRVALAPAGMAPA